MGERAKRIYITFCIIIWTFLLTGIISLIAFRFSHKDWIFYYVIDPYTKCFVLLTAVIWLVQPILCVINGLIARKHRDTYTKRYFGMMIGSLIITFLLWIAVLGMWIGWTGV